MLSLTKAMCCILMPKVQAAISSASARPWSFLRLQSSERALELKRDSSHEQIQAARLLVHVLRHFMAEVVAGKVQARWKVRHLLRSLEKD